MLALVLLAASVGVAAVAGMGTGGEDDEIITDEVETSEAVETTPDPLTKEEDPAPVAAIEEEDDDEVFLTVLDDVFSGSDAAEEVFAGAGSDDISGGGGDDILTLGDGNDIADGEEGDDTIFAEDGDDLVRGGEGNDTIFLGDGDDRYGGIPEEDDFTAGDDEVHGGEGNDELLDLDGVNFLYGDAGSDFIVAVDERDPANPPTPDQLFGGADDDQIFGDDGDTLQGDAGQDFFGIYHDTGYEVVTLTDFDPATEFLEIISDSGATTLEFEDAIDGSGALVTLDGETVAVLQGVAAASLNGSNVGF